MLYRRLRDAVGDVEPSLDVDTDGDADVDSDGDRDVASTGRIALAWLADQPVAGSIPSPERSGRVVAPDRFSASSMRPDLFP